MDFSVARFFVLPSNVGDWLIFKEGLQRAVHRVAGRMNAVETARAMARDYAPSEVIVERQDGSFHRQYAFARGGSEVY
jgi:uncharacterized protein DUF2188